MICIFFHLRGTDTFGYYIPPRKTTACCTGSWDRSLVQRLMLDLRGCHGQLRLHFAGTKILFLYPQDMWINKLQALGNRYSVSEHLIIWQLLKIIGHKFLIMFFFTYSLEDHDSLLAKQQYRSICRSLIRNCWKQFLSYKKIKADKKIGPHMKCCRCTPHFNSEVPNNTE